MSTLERDPREWRRPAWAPSERPEDTGPSREAEERGLDTSGAPEPSWRPETPAWDRPQPGSRTTTSGVGGPLDTATPTPAPSTGVGARPADRGPTGPQPDAGSWADRRQIDRQEVDRQEVDRSEVHEAGGRRQEGGRHEEAEDGARPQGGGSEVHRQEVRGTEVHRPQVHEARGRREEGGGHEEAEDGARPQGGGP